MALTRYHLAASLLQPQTDPLAASTAEVTEDFLSFVQNAAVTSADDAVSIIELSICTRKKQMQGRPKKQVYEGSFFHSAVFAKRHRWVHQCTSVHVAHLSACENVSSQLDLGKVALSDGLEQPVVAHVRLLRLLGTPGSDASPGRARSDLLTAISVRRVLWNKTRRISDEFSPPLTLQLCLYSHAFNQNMDVCMLCFCMFTLPALINTWHPSMQCKAIS